MWIKQSEIINKQDGGDAGQVLRIESVPETVLPLKYPCCNVERDALCANYSSNLKSNC